MIYIVISSLYLILQYFKFILLFFGGWMFPLFSVGCGMDGSLVYLCENL